MSGEATPGQIGGFLVALRLKGETADEIAGCAEAMRAHVLPVQPERDDLVDTAGHRRRRRQDVQHLDRRRARRGRRRRGRREARQPLGLVARPARADVLEALGFELELSPERIAQSIDELGFGFMFAPTHHPAMKHAAPGAPRARGAHGLQRARPAHEPGRRARAGGRRLLAAARARDRRGACEARRAPRVRRPRRRRDRRALAGRAEPRLRGRRRRGAPARDRPARPRRPALRPGGAARRHAPRRTPATIREVFAGRRRPGARRSC